MINFSTNIKKKRQTINSHLKLLNTKRTTTYDHPGGRYFYHRPPEKWGICNEFYAFLFKICLN